MSFLVVLCLMVITLFVCIALLYLSACIRERLNPLRKVPGLPFLNPILGSVVAYYNKFNCQLLECIKLERPIYGKIRKSYLFNGGIRINVSDPKWAKHILSLNAKNYTRGNYVGAECVFAAVGENGLIVVSGEAHRKLRKIASPAFKMSTIKKLMPIIDTCANRMVDLFRQLGPGEVEMKDILNKVTLDIIGLIGFGYDFRESCSFDPNTFGTQLRQWFDFQAVNLVPVPYGLLYIKVFLYLVRFLPRIPIETVLAAQTTNKIHSLVDRIVKEQFQMRKRGEVNDSSSKSLLDFMLDAAAQDEINPQEVHDLLMTFLVAGHETSSLTITWTLYLLAKHPEHQTKCREEVVAFFHDHAHADVGWDDIKELKYLTAVVHESLRMYPPVPWVNRTNIEPDTLGGYHIPAGTEITIIIAEMQRDPDYWQSPDDFIPSRFLESYDQDAFMPFSDGAHKCIGYQLALIETRYLLAVLLKNFEFTIDSNVEYRDFAVITMQPRPNLKLIVKPLPQDLN